MQKHWVALAFLLLHVGTCAAFLRHSAANPGHHFGSVHAGGHSHHHYHAGGHAHGGPYIADGILHRPPAAMRDTADGHGPPLQAQHASPAAHQVGGLPPNPYDHPATGHQYIPPSAQPYAGAGGMGNVGGFGLAGAASGLGSMLPAVGTGFAVGHMMGHHGARQSARGPVGGWQSFAICNAFPSQTPLTMVHWQGQLKKTSTPLLYKTCRAHDQVLGVGDNFTFQLGGQPLGTFNVSRAVNRAVMVLVVTHDAHNSSKAALVSHVFRNSAHSAALVDACGASAEGPPKVMDGNTSLDFNQEVVLTPGPHALSLSKTADNKDQAQVPLEVPTTGPAKFVLVRVKPAELVALPVPVKLVQLAPPQAKSSAALSSPVGLMVFAWLILGATLAH